jgi:hypothetical protein
MDISKQHLSDLTENLKELLISEGALDSFLKNTREWHPSSTYKHTDTEALEFVAVDGEEAFGVAFFWYSTEEGQEFWSKLEDKWRSIARKINAKYEDNEND